MVSGTNGYSLPSVGLSPLQRNLLATMPTMNPSLGHSDVYPNKPITEDQEGSTQGFNGLGHQYEAGWKE